MADSRVTIPQWPDYCKPATAAALLDLSESTFRAIFPTLAARYGLRVYGVAGPKFSRDNLRAVLETLAARGLDITIDRAGRAVRIGDEEFPLGSTASGKSRRGRPGKARPAVESPAPAPASAEVSQ